MSGDRLPHEKGFHVSWDQIHRDSRAPGLAARQARSRRGRLLARGGRHHPRRHGAGDDRRPRARHPHVDTISVSSYDWQKQADAEVLKAPSAEVMGTTAPAFSMVDDLVDTGKTLELVRRLYPKAHFATVYAKPQGRSMVDSYITEVSQDTWIFFPWDMALQYVRPYRGE